MAQNKGGRVKVRGAREALLADSGVRKGYENAKAAREAAELIAFWRDHDKLSGGPVTNAELARRLKVSSQRITNILGGASAKNVSDQGPSYGFLRRACTAMGYEWPFGLFEAYLAVRGGSQASSDDEESLIGWVRAEPAQRQGEYDVEVRTSTSVTLSGTLSEQNG